MSYYYPSLIVGIDGFGRSLVRGVAEDIAGIHGSLLEVLRCVAVLSSALPDPADVDADDRLVSDFAWCETEEAFLAMVGTPCEIEGISAIQDFEWVMLKLLFLLIKMVRQPRNK